MFYKRSITIVLLYQMSLRRIVAFAGTPLLLFSSIAVASLFGSTSIVHAEGTQVQVLVGDMCPNIPGNQPTVPDGMLVDENGDCYTPTPPPQPDACPNIPGNQTSVPNGYYQNTAGDCVPQTVPPQDVCPNIPGIQESVPEGMETSGNGSCVQPLADLCPNIDGPQTVLPEGMEVDESGNCFTPITTQPPQDDTPKQQSGTGTPNKKTPTFFAPFLEALADLVPESIKNLVKQVPPEVARSFPYYVFGVLGVIAVQMMWQTVREAIAAKRFFAILKRERFIAEEKDSFIALSSHYLRTPLTIMQSSLQTITSLEELSGETIEPLVNATKSLGAKIDTILADVESNKALKDIVAPNISEAQTKTLTSPLFWIPVVLAASTVLLSNFLLGVVGEVDLGIGNLWGQLIVFGGICAFLYVALRSRHLRHKERQNTELLIKHEQAIDTARNDFIKQSTAVLSESMQEVENHHALIAGAPSSKFFQDGYERFTRILTKFNLLSQLEAGASGSATTKFNIREAINNSLTQHQTDMDEKKLTITNTVEDYEIEQNRVLFGFVLGSIIDNAVKFSKENGDITIATIPSSHTMEVRISDTGIGVPEDKLPHLFKPFSRAGSSLQFDYEGLGFSLFLDKIIMDYLGGSIAAESTDGKGTIVTVNT